MPFTFHIVSLPHTQTTAEYVACAYTAKVIKFCRMMKDLGHKVVLYASEENEAPCDEFVTVITKAEQQLIAGDYDHRKEFFRIEWDVRSAWWGISNTKAILGIKQRIAPGDFIGIIGGNCQKPIADAFPDNPAVEWGIGYAGVFTNYRVFESYPHMHYIYGLTGMKGGNTFDTVIPNYWDPAEFPLGEGNGDYYLYFGRLVGLKGVDIAVEITRYLGEKLIIAGQGGEMVDGKLVTAEGTYEGDHIEYVGHADAIQRAKLMGAAKAVFVPTRYVEPFGGVAAEAMMCGTPVITSDWGAFTETVISGVTGFRCRTPAEFAEAARRVGELDRKRIRDYAVATFGLERCGKLYDAYFRQVHGVFTDDWDNPGGPAVLSRYERPAA